MRARFLLAALLAAAPVSAAPKSEFHRLEDAAIAEKDLEAAIELYGRAAAAWTAADGAKAKGRALFNRGVTELRLGRFKPSLVSFDAAIKAHPATSRAYINKAMVLQRLGIMRDAVATLELALKYPDVEPVARMNLCVILGAIDEFEKAMPHCDAARKAHSSRMNLLNVAWVRAEMGMRAGVLTTLLASRAGNKEEILPADKDLLPVLLDAQEAYIFALLGDVDSSEKAYERILQARPDQPHVLASRGRARLARGMTKEGLADLDRAISLMGREPGAGHALLVRARAHELAGRHGSADADRKRACAVGWQPACPERKTAAE